MLGEYGTADGKHSATSIVTSLCDLADRYSEDTTVRVRGTKMLCLLPNSGRDLKALKQHRRAFGYFSKTLSSAFRAVGPVARSPSRRLLSRLLHHLCTPRPPFLVRPQPRSTFSAVCLSIENSPWSMAILCPVARLPLALLSLMSLLLLCPPPWCLWPTLP